MRIGTFSRLTGLTVVALRFYDEVGLLRPANVDERTGYRRYASDQVSTAARIQSLRELGISLEEIRQLVGFDPEALGATLRRHWVALEEQTKQLLDNLRRLDALVAQGEAAGYGLEQVFYAFEEEDVELGELFGFQTE